MRIENVNSGEQLTSVGLQLTRSEASELIDSLTAALGGGADRHEHVASSDYQKEITVWIQEDDEALEVP